MQIQAQQRYLYVVKQRIIPFHTHIFINLVLGILSNTHTQKDEHFTHMFALIFLFTFNSVHSRKKKVFQCLVTGLRANV